jgi:hypothetical protein
MALISIENGAEFLPARIGRDDGRGLRLTLRAICISKFRNFSLSEKHD